MAVSSKAPVADSNILRQSGNESALNNSYVITKSRYLAPTSPMYKLTPTSKEMLEIRSKVALMNADHHTSSVKTPTVIQEVQYSGTAAPVLSSPGSPLQPKTHVVPSPQNVMISRINSKLSETKIATPVGMKMNTD